MILGTVDQARNKCLHLSGLTIWTKIHRQRREGRHAVHLVYTFSEHFQSSPQHPPSSCQIIYGCLFSRPVAGEVAITAQLTVRSSPPVPPGLLCTTDGQPDGASSAEPLVTEGFCVVDIGWIKLVVRVVLIAGSCEGVERSGPESVMARFQAGMIHSPNDHVV